MAQKANRVTLPPSSILHPPSSYSLSHPGAARVHEHVVMPWDYEVGDLVDFSEGFLRGLDVVGVGEDLAGQEMVLGWDRVAGDHDGGGGELDQEAAVSGGVAGEGEEVQLIGD